MEEAVKEKKASPGAYYLRIVGTLAAITAVVAILLAGVNMITAPQIAKNNENKKTAAIALVMEGAATFDPLEVPQAQQKDVTELLLAKDDSGAPIGYCVQTSTSGNDNKIQLMVGIGLDGCVTKVSILEHHETAGVSHHGELIARFAGQSGSVALKDDGGGIDAISGATISSRAITKGVNSALAAVNAYLEGGAQ